MNKIFRSAWYMEGTHPPNKPSGKNMHNKFHSLRNSDVSFGPLIKKKPKISADLLTWNISNEGFLNDETIICKYKNAYSLAGGHSDCA